MRIANATLAISTTSRTAPSPCRVTIGSPSDNGARRDQPNDGRGAGAVPAGALRPVSIGVPDGDGDAGTLRRPRSRYAFNTSAWTFTPAAAIASAIGRL